VKTTKAHFEAFKAACFEWRERLGIDYVELLFEHTDIPNATAQMSCMGDCTIATIRLCTKWDTPRPLTTETLDRLARHEMVHVLLAELDWVAGCRFCDQTELTTATERLACRIEALLCREAARATNKDKKGQ